MSGAGVRWPARPAQRDPCAVVRRHGGGAGPDTNPHLRTYGLPAKPAVRPRGFTKVSVDDAMAQQAYSARWSGSTARGSAPGSRSLAQRARAIHGATPRGDGIRNVSWQTNKGFAYAIFERSGLRKPRAAKLRAHVNDRLNVTAVSRRLNPNPKVVYLRNTGRSSAKNGRLQSAITRRSSVAALRQSDGSSACLE